MNSFMHLKLSAKMIGLLGEVIRKRCPHLIRLLDLPQDIEITDSQLDELEEAVSDEFLETGLRNDDTPTARGLLLEDLIGKLRRP